MARGTRGAVEAIVDPVRYMVVPPVVKLRGVGERGSGWKQLRRREGKRRKEGGGQE